MMRLLAIALAFTSVTAAAAGEVATEASKKVEIARDELRRRLFDAQSEGVVELKGEPGKVTPAIKSEVIVLPVAPSLRDDASGQQCLTILSLQHSYSALGANPMQRIDDLRGRLGTMIEGGRSDAEMRLALSYLVSGLPEEARAIARAREGAQAASIVALAEMMMGRPSGPVKDAMRCPELGRLLEHGSGLISGVGPSLDNADITLLNAMPEPIKISIAESLTAIAIERDDKELIDRLREVLLNDNSAAAQLIRFAAGGDDQYAEATPAPVVKLGMEAGPLQLAAIETISRNNLEIASLEDDLEDAAADAAGAVRARAEILLGAHRLASNDLIGAVRALASAAEAAPSDVNIDRVRIGAEISRMIRSKSEGDRLIGIAAIGEAPSFAGPLIDPGASGIVTQALIELGAKHEVEAFLKARGVAREEIDAAGIAALRTVGKASAASIVVSAHASDQGRRSGATDTNDFALGALTDRELARLAFESGNFKDAVRSWSKIEGLTAEEKALYALAELSIASDGTPHVLHQRIGEEFQPLLQRPPTIVDANETLNFTHSVQLETKFIRERLAQ